MSFGFRLNRHLAFSILAVQMSLVLGCGGGKGDPLKNLKKEATGVVKGTVQIDGTPKPAVRVFAFKAEDAPAGVVDPSSNLAVNMTLSGADGKFVFTTYNAYDGLPEGNYVLAFFWNGDAFSKDVSTENTRTTKEAAGFNKKYGNASKSEIKVTAKKDAPVDLGVLDLKTK